MSFENWSGQPSVGTQFQTWCSKNGRDAPPEEIVEAFNTSLDAGFTALKEFLPDNGADHPNLVRNINTFLSGGKRVR